MKRTFFRVPGINLFIQIHPGVHYETSERNRNWHNKYTWNNSFYGGAFLPFSLFHSSANDFSIDKRPSRDKKLCASTRWCYLIKTNKLADILFRVVLDKSNKWCWWCYCDVSPPPLECRIPKYSFPRNLMESIFGSVAFDKTIFHFALLPVAAIAVVSTLFFDVAVAFVKASHAARWACVCVSVWLPGREMYNDHNNIDGNISSLFSDALWKCLAFCECSRNVYITPKW